MWPTPGQLTPSSAPAVSGSGALGGWALAGGAWVRRACSRRAAWPPSAYFGGGAGNPRPGLHSAGSRLCCPHRLPPSAAENFPNAGAGFCAGDSGGPFIVDGGSAAADRQMGIVSWGPGKCGETVNTPCERGCEVAGWLAGWPVGLQQHAPEAAVSLALPPAAETSCATLPPPHLPCPLLPAGPPPPPDGFTDVGEVFPWINQQVFEMTGDWLVPPVAPGEREPPWPRRAPPAALRAGLRRLGGASCATRPPPPNPGAIAKAAAL